MERKAVIPLCTSPRVFDALGLPRADIVTQSHVITKLRKEHKLSEKKIIEGIKGLDDPLFVFRDFRSDDIIIFPGMLAKNNDGKQEDVMAPIQLEKMRDGKHYMASLYPLDSLDKVKAMLKRGNLLYSKNKKEVLRRANSYAPELSPDLLRLLVEENLWEKTITKEDIVKREKEKNYGGSETGHGNYGSFSVTEAKSVRDCVEELAAGRERGMLRNTAWGRDIAVPLGRAGKRGYYGIEHIQEKRILHGLSPDDAAFVTVCALNAAQSVKTPETRGNKDLFDRFGVRAVVAKDDSTGHMVITGFVLNTKGGNRAVDSEAAQLAQHFYALDELSRIQQVGAALKEAVARFEDIVNKNPHDWENVVSYEAEMLKIKEDAKRNGTYMKAPNGKKTKLSERQWAAVRTEAFKNWFGDWERDPENASKVVDENGEPMVVYHGTQRDFGNVFRDPEEDKDWRGQYDRNYAEDTYWFADHAFTAQTYQSPPYLEPDGDYVRTAKSPRDKTPLAAEDVEYTFYKRAFDRGDWSVDTPVSAEEALKKDGTLKAGRGRTSYYANLRLKPGRKTPQGYEGLNGIITQFNAMGFRGKVPQTLEEALDWWNRGIAEDEMPLPRESRLYEVFLNVRNPLIIDEHGEKFREMGRKAYRARNTGHDGLIVQDVRDPGSYPTQISNGQSVAVFKPEQIKSATENRGTYDSRSADISFSVTEAKPGGKRDLTERGGSFSMGSHETLSQVKENWRKLLGDYKAGAIADKSRFIRVAPTPVVLQMLGARALDLTITGRVLDKVTQGKHSIPLEELEHLPEAISDPIIVFESRTLPGNMVVLTEMKEGAHNVIVAVHLNKKKGGHVVINNIASLYGKEKPGALFKQKMLYINDKKAGKWLAKVRLQLPALPGSPARFTIKTPADLVNYKKRNNFSLATFSVIGPRSKTFSKYLDKAFLGRDDGKMRAEIDASQARLKGAWSASGWEGAG